MNTINIKFDIPESSNISEEQFVRCIKDFAATLLSFPGDDNATPISNSLGGCIKVPEDFDYKRELSER